MNFLGSELDYCKINVRGLFKLRTATTSHVACRSVGWSVVQEVAQQVGWSVGQPVGKSVGQ